MDLSIIVPLFNEEDSVGPLYSAITGAMTPTGMSYEVLFVDDGSTDDTWAKVRTLARKDPKLRVIRFRKNYGQTAAMVAGIDHGRGQVLVTMDGDLQNDPADIPEFLRKIDEGYDIVVGWRYNRQDKLLTRKIPSQAANWLIGKVTGVPIKDNGCSLKAYRADVIRRIPLYSEMHRFIPAMTSIAGARIAEIKVRHHARRYGKSKYGLSRIYKVLLDLISIKTIIAFAARPLLWFSILALPAGLLSITLLTVALYEWSVDAERIPVSMAGIGLLFGTLAFILFLGGMLSELIYKTGDPDVTKLSLITVKKPVLVSDESNGAGS